MNIEQYENRMIQALEGDLSQKEYNLLLDEIESNEELASIWNSYKDLYANMNGVEQEIPSDSVKVRFYDWLDDEVGAGGKVVDIAQKKGIQRSPTIMWRKWAGAAAVVVCVFGFWRMYDNGKNVENTLADVSKQMEILMDQQSSTDRIKAIRVNYNPNADRVDAKMINVLIDVLNNDESSNVRLAAVETLANYMNQEVVREALIKRLLAEKDGGVKLSIITSLGQQQDENLKSTLENIVNDDSQEKFVIDEAHMQLIRFEKTDI